MDMRIGMVSSEDMLNERLESRRWMTGLLDKSNATVIGYVPGKRFILIDDINIGITYYASDGVSSPLSTTNVHRMAVGAPNEKLLVRRAYLECRSAR